MRIGFIGSSPISKFHIAAIIKNNFSIEAIGTRKNSINCLNIAKEFYLEDKFCAYGWQEVLEKNIDAVCICTTTSANLEIIKEALDKNIPTLVEKPVAWSPDSINKLINHKNKNKIFVAYNRRYYETIKKTKLILENLRGGTIFVNIPDSNPGVKQFISNGSHLINLLQFLFGDIEVKSSSIRLNETRTDIESVSSICENRNWKILINAHSQIPSNFSITINSGNEVIELKPIEKLSIFKGIDIIEPTLKSPIRKYQPSLDFEIYENTTLKPGFDNMYKSFRKFISEINDHNLCNLNEAKRTLEICYELVKDYKFKIEQ